MNKQIKNKIYLTINGLHDELDRSYELKNELNFDEELGELVATTTRIKILKEFIEIFKLAKKNIQLNNNRMSGNLPTTKDKLILERSSALSKRCKLHFSQLKRLQTENYEDNVMYFTTLFRVLYSLSIHHLAPPLSISN